MQPQGHLLRSARNWLTIRAADGLEIPYVGYFETTVCIAGVSVDDRAILVVRDSGQQFPGVLGMNVLSHVPEFAACLQEVATTDTFRFARAASRQAIRIPARSSVYVHAVGGRKGQTALIEPLTAGCGPLLTTSAAVCDRTFMVAMVNPTENDFWLRPRTRLGILKPADVLPHGAVRVEVSMNEIRATLCLDPTDQANSTCITVVGNFNANLAKQTM